MALPGPKAGLPRARRIVTRSAFARVFGCDQRYVGAGFVLVVAPGAAAITRLGQAISKRRAARAVDRNRIKRIVRESFRRRDDWPAALDIVVIARMPAKTMPNPALFADLDALWQRLIAAPPVGR